MLRFLPVTLLLYFIAPGMKAKNTVLIAASLFFYAWGEPVWVILLIISSIIDYICGGFAGKYSKTPKGRVFLVISLVLNFGLLGFFKYGGFIVNNLNALLGVNIPDPGFRCRGDLVLHYADSFILLMRTGECVQKSFARFLLCIYVPSACRRTNRPLHDVEDQLEERNITMQGIWRITVRWKPAKKTR